MTENPNTLNIDDFMRYAAANEISPENIDALKLALKSLGKRIDYCEYHFSIFQECSTRQDLALECVGNLKKFGGYSIRTMYEANSLAFLQSLHALIDSIPYALNILLKIETDIESRKIGWVIEHLNKYVNYPVYEQLTAISTSPEFVELKGLVNRSKHKHLIPIRNNMLKIFLCSFSYPDENRIEKTTTEQDLQAFMITCHDNLIPRVLTLLNTVVR